MFLRGDPRDFMGTMILLRLCIYQSQSWSCLRPQARVGCGGGNLRKVGHRSQSLNWTLPRPVAWEQRVPAIPNDHWRPWCWKAIAAWTSFGTDTRLDRPLAGTLKIWPHFNRLRRNMAEISFPWLEQKISCEWAGKDTRPPVLLANKTVFVFVKWL